MIQVQIDNVLKEKMMDSFTWDLKHVIQQEIELKNLQTWEEAVKIVKKINAIYFRNHGVQSKE